MTFDLYDEGLCVVCGETEDECECDFDRDDDVYDDEDSEE